MGTTDAHRWSEHEPGNGNHRCTDGPGQIVMAVFWPFYRADGLQVGECRTQMGNPFVQPFGMVVCQFFEQPGQVGAIGHQMVQTARRCRTGEHSAVQRESLDPFSQQPPKPDRTGEFFCILWEICQCRAVASQTKGAAPFRCFCMKGIRARKQVFFDDLLPFLRGVAVVGGGDAGLRRVPAMLLAVMEPIVSACMAIPRSDGSANRVVIPDKRSLCASPAIRSQPPSPIVQTTGLLHAST